MKQYVKESTADTGCTQRKAQTAKESLFIQCLYLTLQWS